MTASSQTDENDPGTVAHAEVLTTFTTVERKWSRIVMMVTKLRAMALAVALSSVPAR